MEQDSTDDTIVGGGRAEVDRSVGPIEPEPVSFASGRYRVERLLGEGGQKKVYLVRDRELARDAVVSLLKTASLDALGIARVRREAEAMSRLGEHPNIVTLYDFGEENGRPYLVCQYVDGGSLVERMKSRGKDRLPLEEVLRLGQQISKALAHAHARGIVHRDLKPGNVWLTGEGVAKLGDFGLALGMQFARVTMEGVLIGTVAYMSPEQAHGLQAEPRSDLYSLGAVLYELVTGRPPFQSDQLVGILTQHIHTAPVAPSWHNPDLPRALEDVILRLLAKVPADRTSKPSSRSIRRFPPGARRWPRSITTWARGRRRLPSWRNSRPRDS